MPSDTNNVETHPGSSNVKTSSHKNKAFDEASDDDDDDEGDEEEREPATSLKFIKNQVVPQNNNFKAADESQDDQLADENMESMTIAQSTKLIIGCINNVAPSNA